jgi:hypothetical protein
MNIMLNNMCWISYGDKWEYISINKLSEIKKGIDYKIKLDWNTINPVYKYLK